MKPRPKRWRMIATMRLRNGLPHRMVLASTIAIPSSVACFEKSSVEPDSVRRSETDASPAVLRVLVVSDPILPAQLTGGLTFVALTAGWRHTCGLTSSGRAYCWGDYDVFFAGANGHAPRPVADNLAFVSLSGGAAASHTCGVTAANVAYCWGHNEEGMLGDGTTANTLLPVRVAGGLAFSTIVAGAEHGCGLTASGILHCWGSNRAGQLGAGFASARSLVPVRVARQ